MRTTSNPNNDGTKGTKGNSGQNLGNGGSAGASAGAATMNALGSMAAYGASLAGIAIDGANVLGGQNNQSGVLCDDSFVAALKKAKRAEKQVQLDTMSGCVDTPCPTDSGGTGQSGGPSSSINCMCPCKLNQNLFVGPIYNSPTPPPVKNRLGLKPCTSCAGLAAVKSALSAS